MLPFDTHAQARTLLRHIPEHGHVAGHDDAGRTVVTLALDEWTLDQLLTFDAGNRGS
jgi:hypothetical protein